MKTLSAALIAVALAIGGVVFLWPTQRTGPEPIAYGRDACTHCRMHISQPGFGAEIRARDGRLTKYDDVGCMLRAMLAMHEEVPEAWVEDHDSGSLVPLLSASLVRADGVETPMDYGIVAFKDEAAARAFAQVRSGQLLALEDVLREPARLVPARKVSTTVRRKGES